MKPISIVLIVALTISSVFSSSPGGAPKACSSGPSSRSLEKRQSIGETIQIRSVGQNQCLKGGDPAESTKLVLMDDCNRKTALQEFTVNSHRIEGSVMLSTPYDKGERCVYTGNADGQYLWTNECNRDCHVFAWNLVKVDNGFLLNHTSFNLCARAEGRYIRMREDCDPTDPKLVWQTV